MIVLPCRLKPVSLTVVVPVFNEAVLIPTLFERLRGLRASLAPRSLQVILVDDGSTDDTTSLIDSIGREAGFVGVHFSRNFGHQAAVSAGIDLATGEHVAVIDGDLQDPPELLPDMLALLVRERADVVYGVRRQRKEGFVKRSAYHAFYRLLDTLTPFRIPLDSGDFCVMSRRVVEVLRSMPERQRFVRGLRAYAGFRQLPFEYERAARAGGEPKYTLARLVRLAADGIVGFSAVPLRLSALLGFLVSAASLGYGLWLVGWRLVTRDPIPGFATVAVGLFFLGGVQLVCLGVMGEYVAQMYGEIKRRPPYVVGSISLPDGEEA